MSTTLPKGWSIIFRLALQAGLISIQTVRSLGFGLLACLRAGRRCGAAAGDRVLAHLQALISEHGLKGAGELFIKAEEAAGVDMAGDEGEEEESEDHQHS